MVEEIVLTSSPPSSSPSPPFSSLRSQAIYISQRPQRSFAFHNTMTTTSTPSYLDRAARKRANQLALIPAEWRLSPVPSIDSQPDALAYIRRILTKRELVLTEETDITILLRKLSSGELTSLELTTAFAKRAALAHQLTTCCTEIFFEEAFATAKQMDEYLTSTGSTLGPLHGLPVSIKDLFSVKGVDTSIGTLHPAFPLLHYTIPDNKSLANK